MQVVAGIIWQQGRLLAAQRPPEAVLGGYWEFPGGKMEAGESREQALIRELREELGIEAHNIEYWKSLKYTYPQGPMDLHFLHVFSFAGEAAAMENQVLRWLYPHEALHMEFLPADLPLLRELVENNV